MIPEALQEALDRYLVDPQDRQQRLSAVRSYLHTLSSTRTSPVDLIRWVPLDRVTPNDYNPNSVATKELRLLYTSILHDGYTQPVVTVYDPERQLYVIVDGFHRYFTMKQNPDIAARTGGLLPIVVIEKDINDRMASTVRHNRARGKHSMDGMSSMVFQMLENGWSDHEICNEIGMEPEELTRTKHITGFSKLFENAEYSRAYLTKTQLRIAQQHAAATAAAAANQPSEAPPQQ